MKRKKKEQYLFDIEIYLIHLMHSCVILYLLELVLKNEMVV